jgi:hypothetical protein
MKSESETSSSSSPRQSFCDGTATSAAAVSSQESLIDAEIIKMEEFPSSSSSVVTPSDPPFVNQFDFDRGVTEIRVKKEEEEVDGTSTSASTSASTINMNCDLNRSVKQDQENDTTSAHNDDDYDYSGWKTGNWCWLLPATDNNDDETTQQLTTSSQNSKNATRSITSKDGNNNSTDTRAVSDNNNTDPHDCGKPEENYDTNTTTAINGSARRLTRPCRSINDEDDGSAEASRRKKKKRNNGDSSRANKNSNTTKQKEQRRVEERESYHKNKNTLVSSTVDDVVDVNSSNDDVDYNDNLLKQSNNIYEGDGYESWTEGNWCLVLPPLHSDNINETKQQSHDLPSTERTAIRSHRELDEDHAENDDDNNDDDSTRKQAGKGMIRYRKKQNQKWNEMYQKLVAYKKEHKSTNVPAGYVQDPKLGNWVHNHRTYYKNKTLYIERINQLESIGFLWDLFGEIWMEMYHKFVAYKRKYKSTLVPWRNKADPQLGYWVVTQRQTYNKNSLSIERINRLESIGFVWDPLDAQWMVMYQKLVAYTNIHNTTLVPPRYKADPQLAYWTYMQRQQSRKSKLTDKRWELLNSIKFAW